MKKLACLILALMMALSVCAIAETEISVVWWGNQTRNERTQSALDLYASENAGVSFDPQFYVWNDYWDKLATMSSNANLPDVLQMDYAYLNQYADAGLLLDLTPFIESGKLDMTNVSESTLASGKGADGGIYALCIGVNGPSLIYNKTLTDSIGVEVPDMPTIDEFMDICLEIYEKSGVKTNFSDDANLLKSWMREDGINLFPETSLGGTVDDYMRYFDVLDRGKSEGWLIDWALMVERSGNEQDPLVYGADPSSRSWCCFAWSNMVESYQNVTEDDLAIVCYPSNDTAKSNYLKPSQFFSVAANTANVDLAVDVLNFWTNSVAANEILLAERGIPISSVVAEAIKPMVSPVQQEVFDFVNNVITPNCSPINPADGAHAGEAEDYFSGLYEQYCYGQITGEEAAQRFFEEGNRIMAGE